MKMFDTRTGVEVIERKECLALLADEVIGRIGILDGHHPLVLPVNYALDGDAIVFRSGPGTKLSASKGGPACFEVDHHDRSDRSGWSVVVRGRLEEVTHFDPELYARVEDLAEPWLPGERPHILRLAPAVISGRRVPARQPAEVG